jgi:hypothetical protein
VAGLLGEVGEVESVLTMIGGEVVYSAGSYRELEK